MPIKNYSKSAQKARRAMIKTYGLKKGKTVFYATANKRGSKKLKAGPARINNAYRKRRH
jgi:hypothetical protein